MLALAGGGAIAGLDSWMITGNYPAKSRFGVHLAAAIFVVAVLGAIRHAAFQRVGRWRTLDQRNPRGIHACLGDEPVQFHGWN